MAKLTRIISDGTPRGTKVLIDDGIELENVVSIHWDIDRDSVSRATIEVQNVDIDVSTYIVERQIREDAAL